MDVNVTGPFLLMRELVPRMAAASHGRVINISSGAVVVPEYPAVSYRASKRALEALTEGVGLQTQPDVAVNALRVDAVVWSEGLEEAQGAQAAAEYLDAVAKAVVWLAEHPITTSGRTFVLSEIRAELAQPMTAMRTDLQVEEVVSDPRLPTLRREHYS